MRGNLELTDGFTASGGVLLLGAHIGGFLLLSGATLSNPDGLALAADGIAVQRNLICKDGFTVAGEVRLIGAMSTACPSPGRSYEIRMGTPSSPMRSRCGGTWYATRGSLPSVRSVI